MAGRRFLVTSNIEVLQQNEGMRKSFLLGSWPLVKFEDDSRNSQNKPTFKPIELDDIDDIAEDDFDDCFHHPEKKRRLTADQVQFLEQCFEFENKLEPERKLQIAKFLGLKPRQVAIWFQNRRARWKTKQMEKNYEALKSRFDALKLDHDLLLKEKEKLQAEVLALTKKLLVKENNESLESFELKKSPNNLPNSLSPLGFDVKLFKQEEISSDNSTILDSESPNYVDKAGYSMLMELTASSNAFEIDNSDRSQIGEVDDVYDLHATEQDLWLWA